VKRLLNEGSQAFELGRLREALSRYTDALELVGENESEGKGHRLRALLLSTVPPPSSITLRTRAHIRMHNKEYDDAIADFRLALELAEFEGEDSHAHDIRAELILAEAVLERSKMDYYEILGIPRAATRRT
ncbi:hypothetical protein BJV74DRAFT_797409, partial [Russula compacta]